jgi:rhodanese-related sulfurtransferase
MTPSDEDRIRDFYLTETAVNVSPHGLRKGMDKGLDTYVLVDTRSEEEYLEEHITGALNVPAYKNRNESAYGEVDRIVAEFQAIRDANPYKDIIVYCYSIPCMTGRKVGAMLAEHDIFVKELNVGWNEWRYDWKSWNHPHEWETTNSLEYVTSGPLPGAPTVREDRKACPIDGTLGC